MTVKNLYKMKNQAVYIFTPRPQSGYTLTHKRLIADEGFSLRHKETGELFDVIDILKDEVDLYEEIEKEEEQEENTEEEPAL